MEIIGGDEFLIAPPDLGLELRMYADRDACKFPVYRPPVLSLCSDTGGVRRPGPLHRTDVFLQLTTLREIKRRRKNPPVGIRRLEFTSRFVLGRAEQWHQVISAEGRLDVEAN